MSKENTDLPPGWTTATGKSCVVFKPLEDFKYAEVRYEPDPQWGHDYALYTVDRDGPRRDHREGIFHDMNKAMQAGDRL